LRSLRHGRWYFSADLPSGTGQRRRVRRGGFATRAADPAALSPGDVQAMFTAITRDETVPGHPASAATLHRIHATLRAAAERRGPRRADPRQPGPVARAAFLGERFRRLSSRPGGGGRKKAGCAVGRSILIIVWHLLNDPAARYQDLGSDWHARHTDRSRKARNARRQLEALGYHVIITLREDAA
jgi:hypothetical protein